MAVSPMAPVVPRRGAERARTGRLIHDSLGLLSSKWAVDVLLALGDGTRRYHQLLADLEPISEKVLTQTLRAMERDGLVGRRVHPEVPPRVEYALTPLGATLAVPFALAVAAADLSPSDAFTPPPASISLAAQPPTNGFMVRHIPDEPLPPPKGQPCLDGHDCKTPVVLTPARAPVGKR